MTSISHALAAAFIAILVVPAAAQTSGSTAAPGGAVSPPALATPAPATSNDPSAVQRDFATEGEADIGVEAELGLDEDGARDADPTAPGPAESRTASRALDMAGECRSVLAARDDHAASVVAGCEAGQMRQISVAPN